MSDLTLNDRGKQFTLNQRRCVDFVKAFAQQQGLSLEIEQDQYLAPTLLKPQFFTALQQALQYQLVDHSIEPNFDVFEDEVTDQELALFEQHSKSIQALAQKTDSTFALEPNFLEYDGYVKWLAKAFEVLQHIEGVPQIDFNSDFYILEYNPNASEIKLAINVLGMEILKIDDINLELNKKQSMLSWEQIMFYILNIIVGISSRVMIINMLYYVQYIGATASETTNLTTVFNSVQLFVSVFLLWLSDIVGRKPIYIGIVIVYTVTTGLLYITPTFPDYDDQITYMMIIRAFMGIAALLSPLGFVIMSDNTTPQNRSLGNALINIMQTVGGFFAAFLNESLGKGKYSTDGLTNGSKEFNDANIKSFQDAMIWAVAFFILGFVIVVLFIKESHPRVLALRKLRKMGIEPPSKQNEMKKEPMVKVLVKMLKNRDIVILFFSYWISMIGVTNPGSGQQIFTSKCYGFNDAVKTKAFTSETQMVNTVLNCIIGFFLSKFLMKYMGEVRIIILAQVLTTLESIINFAIDYPINPYLIYLTGPLAASALIVVDATYLQIVSMYATPQSRGQVLGIFQIGNSVSRILSNYLTGVMYNYQIRDSELLNTLFSSVGVLLLAFIRPPLQRNEMGRAAFQQKEQQKKLYSV